MVETIGLNRQTCFPLCSELLVTVTCCLSHKSTSDVGLGMNGRWNVNEGDERRAKKGLLGHSGCVTRSPLPSHLMQLWVMSQSGVQQLGQVHNWCHACGSWHSVAVNKQESASEEELFTDVPWLTGNLTGQVVPAVPCLIPSVSLCSQLGLGSAQNLSEVLANMEVFKVGQAWSNLV